MSDPRSQAAQPAAFALIIGAMKSGTTTLFELLAQHPQIAACTVKEPRFFSDESNWKKGWEWYAGLWKWNPETHRIALEASTNYTTYPMRPGVPERIASVEDASFRFIYIMRNPLDQIESHVRHTLYLGWGKSLDEGVPDWMIDTVRYASQIDRFRANCSEEQLLLLTLDEFERDTRGQLQRVCRFLGVDPEYAFERVSEKYNRGDAYEVSPAVASVMKSTSLRQVARRLVPRAWLHRLRALLPRLPGHRTELGRYRLTPDEGASVLAALDADLRALHSRYGVDVPPAWQRLRGA